MPLIQLPHILQKLTNQQNVIKVSGNTIAEALSNLGEAYPALKAYILDANNQPVPYVSFYLNDKSIPFHMLDNKITNTDIITLLPALAGG